MYDDKMRKNHPSDHTVAILAYNEPGVLARVTNLIMKRDFNIKTMTAGPSNQPGISRVTISFHGDDAVYEQLVKQLNKLIDVVKVSDLKEEDTIIREVALIKIKTKSVSDQNQIMNFCQAFRARTVNITQADATIEIVGKPSKIDAFLSLVQPLGIREVARTGVTAMARKKGF